MLKTILTIIQISKRSLIANQPIANSKLKAAIRSSIVIKFFCLKASCKGKKRMKSSANGNASSMNAARKIPSPLTLLKVHLVLFSAN